MLGPLKDNGTSNVTWSCNRLGNSSLFFNEQNGLAGVTIVAEPIGVIIGALTRLGQHTIKRDNFSLSYIWSPSITLFFFSFFESNNSQVTIFIIKYKIQFI